MPTTRHRRGRARVALTLETLSLAEKLHWIVGSPCVRGWATLPVPGSATIVWDSWDQVLGVYGSMRESFLGWYSDRREDKLPGIELRFQAWQRGDDPGNVQLPQEPDPRRIFLETR